jgi:thiol-disulfide isomerase/thioredoxin
MRKRQIFSDGAERKKRRPIGRYILEGLVIIAIIVGINAWRTKDTVSGVAPALTGTTLQDETYKLPEKPDEPVLVHFWATWCPVCKLSDSNIESISEDHPVITVAMSSGSDSEVRAHLQKEELTLTVINDESGAISSKWGVQGVPTTFIVDTSGEIRFVETGYTTTVGLRIRRWLAEVL